MKLSIKPAHKDYIFIETDVMFKDDEENVIYIATNYKEPGPTSLYLVNRKWWDANKTNFFYQNRIKIA